ncbi:hypothetical protein ACWWD9_08275 [Methylovorus sp. SPW-M1]
MTASRISSWPTWAPKVLVDEIVENYHLADENSATMLYLDVSSRMCSDPLMESIWNEILKRAKSSDYEKGLVSQVTQAVYEKPTVAQRVDRNAAVKAAKKLRSLLVRMGLSEQSIFPLIGTKACSSLIYHFLDNEHFRVQYEDSEDWKRELNHFSLVQNKENPSLGSINQLLQRLEENLGNSEYYLHSVDDSDESRAKRLCCLAGAYLKEVCGSPLYGTLDKLSQVFFPDVQLNVRDILRSRGITSSS